MEFFMFWWDQLTCIRSISKEKSTFVRSVLKFYTKYISVTLQYCLKNQQIWCFWYVFPVDFYMMDSWSRYVLVPWQIFDFDRFQNDFNRFWNLSSKAVLKPSQIHISMQKHYLTWHNLNSKGRSSKLTFDTFL